MFVEYVVLNSVPLKTKHLNEKKPAKQSPKFTKKPYFSS